VDGGESACSRAPAPRATRGPERGGSALPGPRHDLELPNRRAVRRQLEHVSVRGAQQVAEDLLLVADHLPAETETGEPGDAAEIDPSADTDRERQVRIVNRIRGFLSRQLMTLLMLALPVLGVTLRVLFRRSGRNYAETMAFVFYAVGHAYLVGSVLSLLFVWWTSAGRPLRALSIVGYLAYGATVFFSGPRFVAVIKTLVAYAAYVAAVIVLAVLAALPLILLELNR